MDSSFGLRFSSLLELEYSGEVHDTEGFDFSLFFLSSICSDMEQYHFEITEMVSTKKNKNANPSII